MDKQLLRRELGRWVTGVTVITTMDRQGLPLGKAANSFHTVSLSPPLVAWCVDVDSTRYDEWLAAERYAVHVLGAHQHHLINRFAAKGGDKFTNLDWEPGPGSVPLLAGSHLRLVCRVVDRHRAGDHTYLIGQIEQLDVDSGSAPLAFHRGTVAPLEPKGNS